MKKNWLDWVAIVLVIIGAVNWGLYAFGFNLVDFIFGSIKWLAMIIYVLVGVSGLYLIYFFSKK